LPPVLLPQATCHRRYEAFRAYFIDGQPLAALAARFGYHLSSLQSLVCRFRAACTTAGHPPFSSDGRGRPPGRRRCDEPDGPEPPDVADARRFELAPGRQLLTRVAGIFLFLPLLARLRLDHWVDQASYPGSRMVPALRALLSLLALKLLDKERRSHLADFNESLARIASTLS